MLIHFNVDARNIKQQAKFEYSQETNPKLKGFPAIVLDRYTGVTGLDIWAKVGEEMAKDYAYLVHIGAFCPISNKLMFLIDINHDYLSVSQSGQVPNLIPQPKKTKRRRGSIIIQNDVWIGYGVTVLGGVTIHNGAVVGANSTVTRDVPPYAIVAGNPAKVVKYRFDPETIRKLQEIQWWYWDERKITANKKWFLRKTEEFAEHFYQELGDRTGAAPLCDEQLDSIRPGGRYLVFSDLDDPYGLVRKIIKDFSCTHTEEDCLVVSVPKGSKSQCDAAMKALVSVAEEIESNCGLYIRFTTEEEIPALIADCNYLITSRAMHTVQYTCLADRFGTQIVSGADIPIFWGGGGAIIVILIATKRRISPQSDARKNMLIC